MTRVTAGPDSARPGRRLDPVSLLHHRRGQPVPATHPLDNPAWAALTGPHRPFAQIHGRAARYLADLAPFAALADHPDDTAWADLATLVGPGSTVALAATTAQPPAGWTVTMTVPGVQLIDETLDATPDPEATPLTTDDVPDLLDLVARTQPGPFARRTIELGTYLGLRRDGALIAMAGERLRLPGYTEISAVCTHPDHRGHGLASRLVRAVAAGIRARGEVPFLHAAASNTTAISLYQRLGFTARMSTQFSAVRTPDAGEPVLRISGRAAGFSDRL